MANSSSYPRPGGRNILHQHHRMNLNSLVSDELNEAIGFYSTQRDRIIRLLQVFKDKRHLNTKEISYLLNIPVWSLTSPLKELKDDFKVLEVITNRCTSTKRPVEHYKWSDGTQSIKPKINPQLPISFPS